MKPEFQKHIFESFSREETSTVSGIQGTGLGMAITKNIVDMMGGTITVKSEEGKGSEFAVGLTFKLSGEKKTCQKIEHLQGLKVLVADDDTDTCLNISSMLTEIGMRSEWTVSGKEAVIRTKHAMEIGDEFYAYIIDWLMPVMNGYEAAKQIRALKDPDKASIPIVAMTANAFEEDQEKSYEADMNGHLAKPVSVENLMNMIRKVIRE